MFQYQALRPAESQFTDDSIDKMEKTYVFRGNYPFKHRFSTLTWNIVMLLSIIFNIALTSVLFRNEDRAPSPVRSSFGTYIKPLKIRKLICLEAGLERNVPRPWIDFPVADEQQQEKLWNKTLIDLGNIALADSYAQSMDLPRAQRFPWDSSKGIYLINAYHNLHCVITLRTAILEYHTQAVKQSSPHLHVIHCLNVLRDEIMCDADDTPRYTGFQPHKSSGLGQFRMCRDWSQLEQWAEDHTACWRHIGDISEPGFRELERYRFCPAGSPYEEMARTAWLHE
ncbi:hypothetical protein MMC14_004424 [Varicellaria rhodocarpa]|nr:hypothetical protein [Varicellaria rhodocarpa]